VKDGPVLVIRNAFLLQYGQIITGLSDFMVKLYLQFVHWYVIVMNSVLFYLIYIFFASAIYFYTYTPIGALRGEINVF